MRAHFFGDASVFAEPPSFHELRIEKIIWLKKFFFSGNKTITTFDHVNLSQCLAECVPECTTKAAGKHIVGDCCHSYQWNPLQKKILTNRPVAITPAAVQQWRPYYSSFLLLLKHFHVLCVSWMIGSVKGRKKKKNKMQSRNVSFSWSRMYPGFHGDEEILCSGTELSVSITKRLISIEVLVREEVLEAFRSAGSCATEGQSNGVIAVISWEPCLFYKLAKITK